MSSYGPCKYWLFGFCSRGEKCMYEHNPREFGINKGDATPASKPKTSTASAGVKRAAPSTSPSVVKRAMTDSDTSAAARSGPTNPVQLIVSNIPLDCTIREVNHIFRQYQGFMDVELEEADNALVATVSMVDLEHAKFIQNALRHYRFDKEDPASVVITKLDGSTAPAGNTGAAVARSTPAARVTKTVTKPVRPAGSALRSTVVGRSAGTRTLTPGIVSSKVGSKGTVTRLTLGRSVGGKTLSKGVSKGMVRSTISKTMSSKGGGKGVSSKGLSHGGTKVVRKGVSKGAGKGAAVQHSDFEVYRPKRAA